MEFYVGQEVMIHPNLREFNSRERPTINDVMLSLAGKIYTVKAAGDTTVTLVDNKWIWLKKWLVPLDEMQEDIQVPNMDEIL